MNTETSSQNIRPEDKLLPDLIKEVNSGARTPTGVVEKSILIVTFLWSLFQFWYASPLPFTLGVFILNDTEARAIHLGFSIFLAFMVYPALKTSPRNYVPYVDWILAIAGAFAASYLYIFYIDLADRPGMPTTFDVVVSSFGILLLLEASRRSLGLPLMIIAGLALIYIFSGQLMPDVLAHKGASLTKSVTYQWLTTEGVFGIALGVSTSFVFLFVLFGALLDKAGAGGYFIKIAFALLGHFRGGPAKAGVVSSGLMGLISGSSVANVVTTGTFTIPLMKKIGFSSEKAGAIEAATGINGQIMPPVMGAAAFLMVEYVGIPYGEVCKHAFLPAIISYIALLYMVHLEAVSAGMKGLPRLTQTTLGRSFINFGITASSLIILASVVYFSITWLKGLLGKHAMWVILAFLFASYLYLLRLANQYKNLNEEEEEDEMTVLPEAGPTVRSGLHYVLPVVVLIWCLMVERLSPGLSAFWATCFLMVMMVTQRPLSAFFRKEKDYMSYTKQGVIDIWNGMLSGARNMICIGIATATAGIVVGTVALTGLGLKMTNLIEIISAGNVLLMLGFTAVISLILGMGLPTTANYIVVSTLMAPVLVELGAINGLIIPLIAVHLFVFYFGIMADVTPPVGLASFAAAAVSGADPMRTGFRAFFYSLRTVVLPFFFVFNPQLLLIGIDSIFSLVITIISAIVGMMIFAAALKGYFIVKSKIYETIALLVISFTFFVPSFWLNQFSDPFIPSSPLQISQTIKDHPQFKALRMVVSGQNITGEETTKSVLVPLAEDKIGLNRLAKSGLHLKFEEDYVKVDRVDFNSPAAKAGVSFDWRIKQVLLPANRIANEWMFVPALLFLFFIIFLQRRRQQKQEAS
jgi:TRAP transporter 4TM/12TM fusion protein